MEVVGERDCMPEARIMKRLLVLLIVIYSDYKDLCYRFTGLIRGIEFPVCWPTPSSLHATTSRSSTHRLPWETNRLPLMPTLCRPQFLKSPLACVEELKPALYMFPHGVVRTGEPLYHIAFLYLCLESAWGSGQIAPVDDHCGSILLSFG